MRLVLLFSIAVLFFSCTSQSFQKAPTEEILAFQANLNAEYLDKSTTPLREENFLKFKSHPFFPIDLKYRVSAKLVKLKGAELLEIPTSSGKVKVYRPYARAQFEIEGRPHELTLYQSMDLLKQPEYKDYLFLPFKDATNNESTYGGGKYLDLRIPSGNSNTLIIDFNKSYHPYCAYNAYDYSCPIVPEQNSLSIPIKAGVMYEAVYF